MIQGYQPILPGYDLRVADVSRQIKKLLVSSNYNPGSDYFHHAVDYSTEFLSEQPSPLENELIDPDFSHPLRSKVGIKLTKAVVGATLAYFGPQKSRKTSDLPDMYHWLQCAFNGIRVGADINTVLALYMHDVLEDKVKSIHDQKDNQKPFRDIFLEERIKFEGILGEWIHNVGLNLSTEDSNYFFTTQGYVQDKIVWDETTTPYINYNLGLTIHGSELYPRQPTSFLVKNIERLLLLKDIDAINKIETLDPPEELRRKSGDPEITQKYYHVSILNFLKEAELNIFQNLKELRKNKAPNMWKHRDQRLKSLPTENKIGIAYKNDNLIVAQASYMREWKTHTSILYPLMKEIFSDVKGITMNQIIGVGDHLLSFHKLNFKKIRALHKKSEQYRLKGGYLAYTEESDSFFSRRWGKYGFDGKAIHVMEEIIKDNSDVLANLHKNYFMQYELILHQIQMLRPFVEYPGHIRGGLTREGISPKPPIE